MREEIKRRVEEYGFSGMVSHLVQKNGFTWGDGSYTVMIKIARDRAPDTWIDRYVHFQGENPKPFAYYCQFMFFALVLGMALSGFWVLRKKDYARRYFVFGLAVFGLALFLMVWETRTRYLLHFLPVMLAFAVPGYCKLAEKVRKKTKRGERAEQPS